MTKHSDKQGGKEEKSKRGGDTLERESVRKMECVDVADSAGTVPFPSLISVHLTQTSTAESCL